MGLILLALAHTVYIMPRGEAVTVMTYNILCGAGVDPATLEYAEKEGYLGNRLPRVIEVIKAADPDIIGVQEAHGWDKGSPPIAEQVAEELEMNYYIGRSGNPESGFAHIVLLTKFEIREAENYQEAFSRAALRAELVTPNNQSIHVFVVHLDSSSPEVRARELEFLVGVMTPYLDKHTILMGDMNFHINWLWIRMRRLFKDYPVGEGTVIWEAGWSTVALGEHGVIDQVWASPSLASHVRYISPIPRSLAKGASDHYPLVVKVGLW
jgi:endonuclease/exonuclease/phosphatase family metal-dependent hydrolase